MLVDILNILVFHKLPTNLFVITYEKKTGKHVNPITLFRNTHVFF